MHAELYEELCDFTVQIGDVSFRCHRVILGASSPFFLGLLRSGMKEANEGRVVLQDISVSTFQLILKTLYTGEDVLSLGNFIEIWHAVHMLQIGIIEEVCETFAKQNINVENFKEISRSAKKLNSKSAWSSLRNYILKNFDAVYTAKLYLELSFEELNSIVNNPELTVSSEYVVLQAVLNWAEYKPVVQDADNISSKKMIKTSGSARSLHHVNTEMQSKKQSDRCNTTSSILENCSYDRLQGLNNLLKRVRTCIISPTLLMNVLEHQCIKRNNSAKQIILSAILNQTTHFRHGQWPTAGIYRRFNEYGNYGVCSLQGDITLYAIDPYDEKRYAMKKNPLLRKNVKLVAFENQIYAVGRQSSSKTESKMFVYGNSWKHLVELPGIEFHLTSNENYIYITSVAENVIYRFHPKHTKDNLVNFIEVPEGSVVTHVMSYQTYLLIFCTETVNGVQETAVHMLDLPAKNWTRLDNLHGPAKNIISFRNDDNQFVLQSNLLVGF
ncbi:kelch repeat and BTB domain-containing protein 12-like isoform X2 [Physella acuta]|uniref:kelch repeat and BTB domain-containing protein 12-like isoform X2 n=1 Tax=Physella acuta TaxID=109671 RepID=UPI0027DD8425|nr:kelch repeat and BTB domain-containing protein 12-like isoform X2 [Physella acuta]